MPEKRLNSKNKKRDRFGQTWQDLFEMILIDVNRTRKTTQEITTSVWTSPSQSLVFAHGWNDFDPLPRPPLLHRVATVGEKGDPLYNAEFLSWVFDTPMMQLKG